MSTQEISPESPNIAEQQKVEVAKKYGYKTWEDAYRMNGGGSFKRMIDDVMALCLSHEK